MSSRDELPPTEPAAAPVPETHHGMMARFRNYFLTGLVVRQNGGFDFGAWADAFRQFPSLWNAECVYTDGALEPA